MVGGRNTQSALYRVTYVGNASTEPGPRDDRLAPFRRLRQSLERFHGRQDAAAVDSLWPFLGDDDRALRHAARVALEWQEVAQWRDRAFGETDARRAIAALVALARVSGKDALHRKASDPAPDASLRDQLLAALQRIEWSSLAPSDQLDLLRAYGLVFIRLDRPDDETADRLATRFDDVFPATRPELNIQLANILVYLQSPNAARKTMELLRHATTQEEQIEYVLALRTLRRGWTMPLREEYFRWFVDRAPNYRGGNTFASSLRTIKNEAVANLDDQQRAALQPILSASPTTSSLQEILANRPFVQEWTIDLLVPKIEQGLHSTRDYHRGRQIYSQVACAACHRFNQEGGSVGPDLSAVAGRFSVRDLLEALVEPSKVISDQYGAVVIQKTDGTVVTGRVGNLSGNSLQVIENMFEPGKFQDVRRQDIEAIEPSKVSMMPSGLLNSLEIEEILDLVAYLLSRGDPSHAMFRPDSSSNHPANGHSPP
jgi:putative heme-binding domain-containing protein